MVKARERRGSLRRRVLRVSVGGIDWWWGIGWESVVAWIWWLMTVTISCSIDGFFKCLYKQYYGILMQSPAFFTSSNDGFE